MRILNTILVSLGAAGGLILSLLAMVLGFILASKDSGKRSGDIAQLETKTPRGFSFRIKAMGGIVLIIAGLASGIYVIISYWNVILVVLGLATGMVAVAAIWVKYSYVATAHDFPTMMRYLLNEVSNALVRFSYLIAFLLLVLGVLVFLGLL